MNNRSHLLRWTGIANACFALSLLIPSYSFGQESLGSKMTLEELKAAEGSKELNSDSKKVRTLLISKAIEPTPIFKHRLWPLPTDLKPGSAYVNLSRALVKYQLTPEKKLSEWIAFQIDHEKDTVSSKAIEDQLRLFQPTLAELHISSEREDVTWDHRIRDLSGSGLYHYMLPELQQTRDLGRLLRWQAIERLRRGDFEGTIQSVRSGFRLAYLVRSGETIIQQLVANAIEATMEDALLDAIQQPGCPSLYWALATVPQNSESMCRALQIEMSSIARMLAVFRDNEQLNTDRKHWQSKWRESFRELVSLGTEENAVLGLSTTLALECAAVTSETRSQLIAEGLRAEQVESMCPEQIVAITTQREIRRVCDALMRSAYLPIHQAKSLSHDPYGLQSKQGNRIASVVLQLLVPATNNIQVAAVNRIASHNRLMTIEAIRLYATKNDGGLPETLEDLSPVPAFTDPFTNKLIRYKKGTEDGVATATLEIDRPNHPEYLRQLKLQVAK